MGSVRGKSTKDNVVLVTKCHGFERVVGAEAVTDQDARLSVCTSTSIRIKGVLNSRQADGGINVS